jgi:hypothetical protein
MIASASSSKGAVQDEAVDAEAGRHLLRTNCHLEEGGSVSAKVAKEPDETDAKAEKAPEAKTAKLDCRLLVSTKVFKEPEPGTEAKAEKVPEAISLHNILLAIVNDDAGKRPTSSMQQHRHRDTTAKAPPQKQSDMLVLGGWCHDANAAVSTTRSTKYLILSALTTLAFLVPYYKEISYELGRSDMLTNIAHIHYRPQDRVAAGPYPKQVAPLDPSEKFSFVHISKCAGSTWIRLLSKVLKLNICPEKENGPEFSVSYQQRYACKDAKYTLISL